MSAGSVFTSLLWFVAILALIPAALWLLKRTPAGGAAAQGVMRVVAMLPISTNQRLLAVEVGRGAERRWLLLGVSPAGIQTLHQMAPIDDLPGAAGPGAPFAQLLARFAPAKNESAPVPGSGDAR